MSESPKSSKSSDEIAALRFRVSQTLALDEVAEKIKAGSSVSSTGFFCQHDPQRPTFKLQIGFGSRKAGFLSCRISSLDRDVYLTGLNFSIFDKENKRLESNCSEWNQEVPELVEVGQDFGWNKVLKYRDAAKGKWRVICEVEYIGTASEVAEPIPDGTRIQKDFLKLLNTEDRADVTFVVQGETIKAHKNILTARCEHFERMFQSRMKESDSNRVVIPDIRPNIFREMLKFLYVSQKPKFQDDITMDLLSAADKYGLEDLVKMCENAISRHLTADNVIDALLLAERCSCTELMASASALFRFHARVLKKGDQWAKMMDSPTLQSKLLEFCFE